MVVVGVKGKEKNARYGGFYHQMHRAIVNFSGSSVIRHELHAKSTRVERINASFFK